jgi:hypothetical protein
MLGDAVVEPPAEAHNPHMFLSKITVFLGLVNQKQPQVLFQKQAVISPLLFF